MKRIEARREIKRNANKETSSRALESLSDMIHEDTDTTLLRLIQAYTQSAPQLTLQLYVIAVTTSGQDESVSLS